MISINRFLFYLFSLASFAIAVPVYSQDVNWVKQLNATEEVQVMAMYHDKADVVYLSGYFSGTVTFGGKKFTSKGFKDVFIARLDTAWKHIWMVTFGSDSIDMATGISFKNGILAVSGVYFGQIKIGSSQLLCPDGRGVFCIKMDTSGSIVWANFVATFPGEFADFYRTTIQVLKDSSIILGCNFQYSATLHSQKAKTPITRSGTASQSDVILARYDPDGRLRWNKVFNGTVENVITSSAIDDSANFFLCGWYRERLLSEKDTLLNSLSASGGSSSGFLIKLDSSGNVKFGKNCARSHGCRALCVSVSRRGEILVGGNVGGTAYFDSTSFSLLVLKGFLAKYNQLGELQWVKIIGDSNLTASVSKCLVTDAGNIYISGLSGFNTNNGDGSLCSRALSKKQIGHYLNKLDANGNCRWVFYTDNFKLNYPTTFASVSTLGYYYNQGDLASMENDSGSFIVISGVQGPNWRIYLNADSINLNQNDSAGNLTAKLIDDKYLAITRQHDIFLCGVDSFLCKFSRSNGFNPTDTVLAILVDPSKQYSNLDTLGMCIIGNSLLDSLQCRISPHKFPATSTGYHLQLCVVNSGIRSSYSSYRIFADTFAGLLLFSDSTICSGQLITLVSKGSDSTNWFNASGFLANTLNYTLKIDSNCIVSAIVSKGGCSDTLSVNLKTKPNPHLIAPGNFTVCGHDSILLLMQNADSCVWQSSATDTFFWVKLDSSTYYRYYALNKNGCSIVDSVFIIYGSPPIAAFQTNNPASCGSSSFAFSDTVSNQGVVYSVWDIENTSSGWDTTIHHTLNTINLTLTDTGKYSVTLTKTSSQGCVDSLSKPDYVWVHPLPEPEILVDGKMVNATGKVDICFGDTANLTVIPANAGIPAFARNLWNTNDTSASISVPMPSPFGGQGAFSVQVWNEWNCYATSEQVQLKWLQKLTVNLYKTLDSITAKTNRPVATYEWYRNGQQSTVGSQPYLYHADSGTYTVTVTDSNGCTATSSPLKYTAAPLPPEGGRLAWIYPNPTTGEFSLEVSSPPSGVGGLRLSILDLSGRTLLHLNPAQRTFSTASLAKGMYLLAITLNGQPLYVKLVKE